VTHNAHAHIFQSWYVVVLEQYKSPAATTVRAEAEINPYIPTDQL